MRRPVPGIERAGSRDGMRAILPESLSGVQQDGEASPRACPYSGGRRRAVSPPAKAQKYPVAGFGSEGG
jgi:hypothetical protein